MKLRTLSKWAWVIFFLIFSVFALHGVGPVLGQTPGVRVQACVQNWYVAPDGRPGNTGTLSSPLDISTALSGSGPGRSGDCIWLREGRYGMGGPTVFTSTLNGTESQPIIVRQYPGERATIDGGIDAQGAWTWFWGFEITNSYPERNIASEGGQTWVLMRPYGLYLKGRGHKAINLVIHDVGHPAIGFFSPVGDGGEVYGSLIYNNGFYDTTRSGQSIGSAIYAQNQDGTRYIRDIIAFRNFTTGINIYTEQGYTNGFHVEGNAVFDNALWDVWATGGIRPMERLKVLNNTIYRRASSKISATNFGFGTEQGDITYQGNTVAGGSAGSAIGLNYFRGATVTDNTFVVTQHNGESGQIAVVKTPPGIGPSVYLWNENTYFDNAIDHGGTTYTFAFNNAENRFGGGYLTFDDAIGGKGWKQWTGWDAHSHYQLGRPTTNKISVRPNLYEPGRAHIVVYNWENDDFVEVDVSGILKPGERYEVRDAQNFFGAPVASGTYSGGPVSLPMRLTAIAPFVGNVYHLPQQHTAPEFGVFVLMSLSDGPTPTPDPVINSFSVSGCSTGSPSCVISEGQTITLNWNVTNATGLILTAVGPSTTTSRSVFPLTSGSLTDTLATPGTYAYTLTASNGEKSVRSQTLTITVNSAPVSPPTIGSFSASSASITAGESITLSWQVSENTTDLSIAPLGPISPVVFSGTRSVLLNMPGTYAYTLTAGNRGGRVSSQPVTVQVIPRVPVISSFTSNAPGHTISLGQSVILSWSLDLVSGGEPAELTLNPGAVSVLGLTSKSVTPGAEGKITYTLVAKNSGGTASKSLEITVVRADSYFEAEASSLTSPMIIAESPQASEGRYITSTTANSGTAVFTVNLTAPGAYIIWARVLAPDARQDSFFVSVDGGPEDIYDAAENTWSSIWQWTRVNGRNGTGNPLTLDPRTFNLSAGNHTIKFRMREANSKLDRIFITSDANARPMVNRSNRRRWPNRHSVN